MSGLSLGTFMCDSHIFLYNLYKNHTVTALTTQGTYSQMPHKEGIQ